jgi:DNA helicase HerA-like ATPase
VVLIAGKSGGGKTTLATGILERLAAAGYQFCIIDPEGDYEYLENVAVIGDAQRAPTANEVAKTLGDPGHNVVVNLLGVDIAERPSCLRGLLARLQELRAETGRRTGSSDEAHHLLPATAHTNSPPFVLGTVDADPHGSS